MDLTKGSYSEGESAKKVLKHAKTKKCPKVAKKDQYVQQRQRYPHVTYLAKQTTRQCLNELQKEYCVDILWT